MSDFAPHLRLPFFSGSPEAFWPAYLAFACRQVGAPRSVLIAKNASEWTPWLHWSVDQRGLDLSRTLFDELCQIAENCWRNGRLPRSARISEALDVWVVPVCVPEGDGVGAMVLFGTEKIEAENVSARMHLGLVAEFAALYQFRERAADRHPGPWADVLDVLKSLNVCKKFQAAAMTLVNETAARYGFSRVSLGWSRKGYVHLCAISHLERFDKKMASVTALETAMEEALDQNEALCFPAAKGNGAIVRDHKAYARLQKAALVISLPIRVDDQPVAVLTCESEKPTLKTHGMQGLRMLCDQAAYQLSALKAAERWLGARIAQVAGRMLSGLWGPSHTLAKLTAVLISALMLLICTVRMPYRVETTFILRSENVRQVAAPFDGYIDRVSVQTGQAVEVGDDLLSLDNNDLLLEESAAIANQIRFVREVEKARALNTLIEMQIAQARVTQAQAQLDLIRYRLEQARMRAPIRGIVVEGDLDELLGAPVEKGDILFKVARAEDLYVELKIGEQDIHEILKGQSGHMAFVSQPQLKYPLRIEQIDPVAVAEEQGNLFVARAHHTGEPAEWWRPGMSGIAKIDVGTRRMIWVLSHRSIEFLRMLLWW